jgi:CheY-like chemotaxis protein
MIIKKKILVVDDEILLTETLDDFFKGLGHEVSVALNGEEAIKAVEKHSPEIVLLDLEMPKVKGIEVLKVIRKRSPNTKVLIITGHPNQKADVEAIGIDGFFVKPIQLSALIDRIQEILIIGGDTRVYPTEETKELSSVPTARIILFEPDMYTYMLTCGLLKSEKFLGKREFIEELHISCDDALNKVINFRPDIAIIYDPILPGHDTREFAKLLLSSSYAPKKVILHGLFPKGDYYLKTIDDDRIIYCNQNFMTDEIFRQVNQKLLDMIDQICLKEDLIKK